MTPFDRRDDRGRTEVYAAEAMAFEGTDLEEVVAFELLAEMAHTLVRGSWWRGGLVEVRPARSDAASSSARPLVDGSHRITLAASQCTRATLIHELAHVLAGVDAGHGPAFRRAQLDVACALAGSEHASWLDAAYRSAGLSVGTRAAGGRSWVEPPPADAPIAL